MQQKQRLKSLDRFKRAVNEIEAGTGQVDSAILVCTDVAARGLDIPYVSNVVHYQVPFNAEIYVHRCGRTARIGRKGESLSIISAEDNKSFKQICQVLKKTDESFSMFEVKYNVLDKIRPLIDQAKDLEKSLHRTKQDEKSANWLIQQAKDAELELDEELQFEVQEKLGSKRIKLNDDVLTDSRIQEFKQDESIHRKRETKQQMKDRELKRKYDLEIEA